MATNDFLTFSYDGSALNYTNAEYLAHTQRPIGNQIGIADPKLVNKAIRQSSIMGTVLAQYISDITGANAVDDGTTTTLLANLKTATSVSVNTHASTSKTTPADLDEIPLIDSASSFGLKKLTWANIKTALSHFFAPTASPTFTGVVYMESSIVFEGSMADTNETTLSIINPTADRTITFPDRSFTVAGTDDLKEIGVNQTRQNMTTSRLTETTYTNSTGKPIIIQVSFSTTTNAINTAEIRIDGVATCFDCNQGVTGGYCTVSDIVPNGSTYFVTNSGNTLYKWMELR